MYVHVKTYQTVYLSSWQLPVVLLKRCLIFSSLTLTSRTSLLTIHHTGEKYAFSDYSRPYTRNLVHEGNGKSNLVNLLTSFLRNLTNNLTVNPRLDPRQRKLHPRPRQRPLPHAHPQRQAKRDPLQHAQRRRATSPATNPRGEGIPSWESRVHV